MRAASVGYRRLVMTTRCVGGSAKQAQRLVTRQGCTRLLPLVSSPSTTTLKYKRHNTTMSNSAVEQRKAAVEKLRSIMGDGLDQSFWSKAWQQQATPWDKGHPQPSLVNFLTKTDAGKQLVASQGKGSALVPGAGTGVDVELFASLGWSPAQGIDIAPEAIESGKRWLAKRDPQPYHANVQMKVADFFEDPKGELKDFSLAYDYTFLCAIPPSLRPKWGEAYARSVKSGGHLICLVYPIEGDRTTGPPVSVCTRVDKGSWD